MPVESLKPHELNGVDLAVLEKTVAAVQQDPGLGKCRFRARNRWLGGSRNCTTVYGFYAANLEKLRHLAAFSPVLNTLTKGVPVELQFERQ